MSAVREPEALLRELAEEHVPPEDPAVLAARRERLLPTIGRTVREAAARRERLARWRKVGAAGLAAAAVALAVGAFHGHYWSPKVARVATPVAQVANVASVRSVTGTIVVTHGGRARLVAPRELPFLAGGDQLETAADGGALLETERSAIQVQPATQVSVMPTSMVEERIRLALGRLDLKVSKQPQSPRSVVVETPDTEVVVRGTEFTVAVGSEHDVTVTRVRVTEGAVWVLHGGERELLSVGEEWSSKGDGKSSVVMSGDVAAPATPVEPMSATPARSTSSNASSRSPASSLTQENSMVGAAFEARNRGDDRKAIELFSALLTRYPDGHLAELAQLERMRALKRSGDNVRAQAEARRYLAEHGSDLVTREEARGIALGEK